MVTLVGFPKNKGKYIRLIKFFKEIRDICVGLNVTPILDGSLAVFAYAKDRDMDVNDVDASVPEAEFPRIIKALGAKGIDYKLKDWHVLQVLRDNLKIDLGSVEFWTKDLASDCDTLLIDDYKIKVLSIDSLREFYRRGMEDRAKGTEESDKIKYERLKAKWELLSAV